MTRPTFLSLFSGIGGLDLGLERAGWQCVGQVEIDPFCQQVLAKHWPDMPRWGDIREVDPDDLPRADLIAGGFPCQPVSLAGRRRGQDDQRWLWPEFARIVRHLRPGWVLVENVPGLLARGMGDVLGDLARLGYDAEWCCLSAADVGAPHLRERVWVVAYPELRRRDGLHERLEQGHLASNARGGRPDGPGWPTAENHRRGVPRQGPQGGDVPNPERQQLRDEPGRRNGQSGTGQAIPGDDGQAWPLADPAGARCPAGAPGAGGPPRDRARRQGSGRLGGPVADARGQGWDVRPRALGQRGGVSQPADGGWWTAEPDVGRVVDGPSARLDRARLTALGNAVVPQIAELIGRRILKADAA